VGLAVQNLRAEETPDGRLAVLALRGRLSHDILPAFDDLYRCVQSLRASTASRTTTPLWNLIEWTFAVFVDVLARAGLRLLHPLRERFDPHLHEATARLERQDLPSGSIIEVSQLGLVLGETLLRPARVTVAYALPPASGPSNK
jgi:molecular chaperone GrpE